MCRCQALEALNIPLSRPHNLHLFILYTPWGPYTCRPHPLEALNVSLSRPHNPRPFLVYAVETLKLTLSRPRRPTPVSLVIGSPAAAWPDTCQPCDWSTRRYLTADGEAARRTNQGEEH
jgi:hypothetical protein